MSRHYHPQSLDVAAFARDGASLSGAQPLVSFQRLLRDAPAAPGETSVQWSARGELREPLSVSPQVWLHVQLQAHVPQTCQRCLGVVELPVSVARSFRFAPDEAQAAALDEEAEEDVLVLAPDFSLFELFEDELLLELPIVARHEVCPSQPKMAVADPDFEVPDPAQAHPFAALAVLRTTKTR